MNNGTWLSGSNRGRCCHNYYLYAAVEESSRAILHSSRKQLLLEDDTE